MLEFHSIKLSNYRQSIEIFKGQGKILLENWVFLRKVDYLEVDQTQIWTSMVNFQATNLQKYSLKVPN